MGCEIQGHGAAAAAREWNGGGREADQPA
jgi:hypothetical protein